jgi:hypothetical protein
MYGTMARRKGSTLQLGENKTIIMKKDENLKDLCASDVLNRRIHIDLIAKIFFNTFQQSIIDEDIISV